MRRIPSPATVIGVGAHLLAEAIRPRLTRYRREHVPGLERTVVAIGPRGCFEGVGDGISEAFRERVRARREAGLGFLTLLGTFQSDPGFRLRVIPHGEDDLVVYVPTNHGPANGRDGLFDLLDDIHEAVAARARHAVTVEYGSHPDLDAPISLVRADGAPSPGDPALALAVANLAGHDVDDLIGVLRKAPLQEGALGSTFGAATALHAVGATGDEAAAALTRAMDLFSRRSALIRPPGETPRDVVVVDLGAGRVFNPAGDSVDIEPASAPMP